MRDLAGNALASDYPWSFTAVDTTKPIVSSTSPANRATGVAINSGVNATFNEAMQSSTINTNTFTVSDGSRNISGTVSYNDTTATFTPSGNLSHFTTYTARITTGVRDLAGNAMASDYTWSFTTTDDADPPTVSSTIPANGAAGVATNSTITATFSEAMQSSSITTTTFIVSAGSSQISGTVSYSGTTATFTPSRNLSALITYTARITTGVRDLAGNALASPYTWSFTTTGDVDITPPTVSSTSPVNGAANVNVNSTITATFSEEMQSSTINTNTFTVSDGNGNIGGTVSYNDTTTTFTPSANLDFNTVYTATITIGARDLTSNALASDFTWSFATISALPTPTPTPSPENKGVVFGVVYDLDKESLKGVTVTIKGVTVTITGTNFSDSTETDENGYYEFGDLEAGDYTLTYEKEGYQIQTHDIRLGEGESLDLGTIKMVSIGKGKISGHILDTEGEPISGAKIRLKRGKKALKPIVSDMNGFFEFGDLEAGKYKIFVTKKSYKRTKETVLLEEGEEKEIEIHMKKSKK